MCQGGCGVELKVPANDVIAGARHLVLAPAYFSRLLKIYCGANLRRCRSLKTSTYRGTPRLFARLRLASWSPHDVFQQPVG